MNYLLIIYLFMTIVDCLIDLICLWFNDCGLDVRHLTLHPIKFIKHHKIFYTYIFKLKPFVLSKQLH